MTLILVALVAALMAWRQLSRPEELSRPFVIRALVRWLLGFLGVRLLSTGFLHPGGVAGTIGSGGLQGFVVDLAGYGAALLLWSGIVDLALRSLGRREQRWLVLPGAAVTLLLTIIPGVPTWVVAFPSIGLLYRFRWKSSLSGAFRLPLFLCAVVLLVPAFLDIQTTGARLAQAGSLADGLHRISEIVAWLARIQLILLLPRLLGGRIVYFRTIRHRLALSHVLIGLVPLLLALVFWGVLSYMSVGTERALIAVRSLEAECVELRTQLAAARTAEGDDPGRIGARLADRYPGVRVLLQSGGRIEGLEDTAPWPDSLPEAGIVVMGPTPCFGARIAAARPGESFVALAALGHDTERDLGRRLRAALRLHAGSEVTSRRGGFQINTGRRNVTPKNDSPAADSIPGLASRVDPDSATGGSSPFRVSGAATIPVLRTGPERWRRGTTLLTAWVPFNEAVIGLFTGLRENPFAVVPLALLGFLALLLALVENFTIRMVVGLSQSVTGAVAALRRATVALQSGNLGYRIPIRPEDNDELWTVAASFNSMAIGLEAAREAEREKERLEKELQLARQIQARLLPDRPPVIAGLDLSGLSFSAQEVGGDYYDFIPMPDGRIGLIVADVSGKGIPASLLMSAFRASLLSQPLEGDAPGIALERINRFLHGSVEPGRFVTAFLGFLNPTSGAFHYSNAGHNPPFVFPGTTGRPSPLIEGGVMLGAFPTGRWPTARTQLAPGDLLVLYTDGVTEAQNEAGAFWDEEGLLDFVDARRGHPCGTLAPDILAEVRRFEGQQGPSDDITLLLARRTDGT